jgi:uncharacterized membrane protein (DUF4010 family)
MSETFYFFQQIAFALVLGALIGLEREKHKKTDLHAFEFGGIRTLSLVSLYGFLSAYLFLSEPILFGIFSGGFILLVITSYFLTSKLTKASGATSEMSALFTYLLGVLVAMGENVSAAALALIVLMLLYFKAPLHQFAHNIEKQEWLDTFKFIAISFVVLPLLPNQTYGPLDVLNPYVIWFVVVLISTISFVSYIAIKLLGPKKGIGMGGLLGGLISSTAVAMSFSELSKRTKKKIVDPFVFGILVASAAMFFRVLLEVSVINPDLLPDLYGPLVSMGVFGLMISFYFWVRNKDATAQVTEKELNLKSPFQLWPAFQFALLFAGLLFVSKFMNQTFGQEGVYLTAFVSGIIDVDAITVSLANLSKEGDLTNAAAAVGITIASMTNTIVKGFIVYFFASKKVGRITLLSMVAIIMVGVLSLYLFSSQFSWF